MTKVFLIGGPGNISSTTITDLTSRGDEVAVFSLPQSLANLSASTFRKYPGDREDTPALAAALQDFHPDIVIDFVCFHPTQAQALYSLLKGRVAQCIFISTVDVYGYPLSHLPMRESDPFSPPNCEYAANKRLCEEFYQSRFHPINFPLSICRPVYSFGNHFVLTAMSRGGGRYLITRLRNHMPILVPGDGTTLLHVSASYNTGRMIARVAGHTPSIGEDYTIGHNEFMTHEQYIHMWARLLGVEPLIVHIPLDVILSFNTPETNELLPILTGFNVAFSVDKFKTAFPDFQWTMSLEEWGRRYIVYNDEHGNFPQPEEEIIDDRIIHSYQNALKGLHPQ